MTYCIYIRYNNANKLLNRQTKGNTMNQLPPQSTPLYFQDDIGSTMEWLRIFWDAPLHDQIGGLILMFVVGAIANRRKR